MEIVGGFMVMMWLLGLILTVVWLVMPFVILAMKGKVERNQALLESIDRRLAAIEERLGESVNAGGYSPETCLNSTGKTTESSLPVDRSR